MCECVCVRAYACVFVSVYGSVYVFACRACVRVCRVLWLEYGDSECVRVLEMEKVCVCLR